MQRLSSSAIACSHCRHYVPEGRRGGNCQLLGVVVQGSWQACSLSIPFFELASSKKESTSELEATTQIGHPIKVMPSQQLMTQYLARHAPCIKRSSAKSAKNLLR